MPVSSSPTHPSNIGPLLSFLVREIMAVVRLCNPSRQVESFMNCRIESIRFITREMVRANRDKLFLFGDNLERRGYGGQAAAMRGEPNAIGIPTKKTPTNKAGAFFTDLEFDQNKDAIDAAFAEITNAVTDSIRAIVIFKRSGYRPGAARQTSTKNIRVSSKTPRRISWPIGQFHGLSHVVPAPA